MSEYRSPDFETIGVVLVVFFLLFLFLWMGMWLAIKTALLCMVMRVIRSHEWPVNKGGNLI